VQRPRPPAGPGPATAAPRRRLGRTPKMQMRLKETASMLLPSGSFHGAATRSAASVKVMSLAPGLSSGLRIRLSGVPADAVLSMSWILWYWRPERRAVPMHAQAPFLRQPAAERRTEAQVLWASSSRERWSRGGHLAARSEVRPSQPLGGEFVVRSSGAR
jgi:hypothetical protein